MPDCKSCGAAIEFVETKNGKQMPMDVAESDCKRCEGTGVLVTHMGSTAAPMEPCRWCGGEGRKRMSHFATCPTAAQHRKQKV